MSIISSNLQQNLPLHKNTSKLYQQNNNQLIYQNEQSMQQKNTNYLNKSPQNSSFLQLHKNNNTNIDVLSVGLLIIIIVNIIFNKICMQLPQQYYILSYIFHMTDILLTVILTSILISQNPNNVNNLHNSNNNKYRNNKYSKIHLIIYISISKYITLINNNLSYNNNIIFNNLSYQIIISLLYYVGYCYSTGKCKFSLFGYFGIGIIGLLWMLYTFIGNNNILQGVYYSITQSIGAIIYYFLCPISKYILQKIINKQHNQNITQFSINPSPQPIQTQNYNKFHIISQQNYHILYFIFSLTYFIIFTTPYCYNNYQYILIIIITTFYILYKYQCNNINNNNNNSKKQYYNIFICILYIYIIIFVYQYMKNNENNKYVNQCQYIINVYGRYISFIIGLAISYLHIIIQQYRYNENFSNSQKKKVHKKIQQQQLLYEILLLFPITNKITNININNYNKTNIKIYKHILLTIQILFILISLILYKYLSYHNIHIILCKQNINNNVIYFHNIVLLLVCTHIFINNYQLYTTDVVIYDKYFKNQRFQENLYYCRKQYSYRYKEIGRKIFVWANFVVVCLTLYVLIWQNNIQKIQLIQNNKNIFINTFINLFFPTSNQLQHYYNLFYSVNECYPNKYSSSLSASQIITIFQILQIILFTIFTILIYIKPIQSLLNHHKFNIYYKLYITLYIFNVICAYILIAYGIYSWECTNTVYWVINYIYFVVNFICWRDVRLIVRYNKMKIKEKQNQNNLRQLQKKYKIFNKL